MYCMPRAQDDIQGCISVAKSRMLGATAQERRMYRMYGTILVIGDDVQDALMSRVQGCTGATGDW